MQNHSYIVGLIKMGGNLDLAQELKFASPCAKKKKKRIQTGFKSCPHNLLAQVTMGKLFRASVCLSTKGG